jgi:hypothetical protein
VYDEFGGDQPGVRAIELVDTAAGAATLDVLGRCDRNESCESAPRGVRGIAATLHLVNGPLVNRRLAAEHGRLRQLIAAETGTKEIVEEFYLTALTRRPTPSELGFWLKELDAASGGDERAARLEDFLWSLLNSNEFMTK